MRTREMIEIKNVRCCNEPLRNRPTTVLNWTSPGIGTRIIDMPRGVSMKLHALRSAALALFVSIAILLAPRPASGQEVTGAITGTVTDPSGAAVADAAV